MKSQISLCYHPTKVVLVDDNPDFIAAIKLELGKELRCSFYTNPLKALEFFKMYKPEPFTKRCFVTPSDEKSDHLFFNVDLRQIHKEVHVSDRFNEIAVVVIDYTMSRVDGLELSRQLKIRHPNIRIILLTGEADHDLAVMAFNEGIIDKFIKKGSQDLSGLLIKNIRELEQKYFLILSQSIIDKMNGSSDKLYRLRDPHIINFFNQLCREKAIIEYYLIDSNGSFLLIDNKGCPYWLALLSNQELYEFYEYAATEKAPQAVISALKDRQKMPFFYTDDDLTTPPSGWEDYLHPAQTIPGTTTYHYTLIENASPYNWYLDKIISYQTYLLQAA
ncbi:MAG: CheY-like receiver [Gammaproteobacteria bacterium]|jgi:CheY-like chemotaxis protein|nr:CheY-like receiver [Gammaproteobacteria bacterium]